MIEIIAGDNLATLRTLPDACIDAVVTDPPYGLSKEPDAADVLRHWLAGDDYRHTGGGFMGKAWDSFVPGPVLWHEVLRVLKPGGHALSFSGTRTYDLMVMAMRLAGFQIRDQLAWMYGTGFPKSLNVAKRDGCETWDGFGTALKPAQEPIVLARKPLIGTVAKNVLVHGTGGINIDGCRIEAERVTGWGGGGSALYEGGLSRDGGDARPAIGRWPANVILDEHAGAMLDEQSDSGGASRFFYCAKASTSEREAGLEHLPTQGAGELTGGRTEGSAGLDNPRAGAGRKSKGRANIHPTVKPIALMRWLVRLVTPPGGVVLDPYVGSGTTAIAAALEGFACLGLELSEDYAAIARARVAHWSDRA